jgi:hypothetical protein
LLNSPHKYLSSVFHSSAASGGLQRRSRWHEASQTIWKSDICTGLIYVTMRTSINFYPPVPRHESRPSQQDTNLTIWALASPRLIGTLDRDCTLSSCWSVVSDAPAVPNACKAHNTFEDLMDNEYSDFNCPDPTRLAQRLYMAEHKNVFRVSRRYQDRRTRYKTEREVHGEASRWESRLRLQARKHEDAYRSVRRK